MAIDDQEFNYDGSTFHEVKEITFSGPYQTMPTYPGLGLKTFVQFLNDSARNLHDKRDIRPRFDKLIHANGICYTGTWRIDADYVEKSDGRAGAKRRDPFTGYFAPGSEGLLISRFSVAGPDVTRGYSRALGIAGKVYPTMDPSRKVMPGNFVTVSTLSGTKLPHVLDIEPTNMPDIGPAIAANVINRILFRMMDTRPGYRQLYPISTLGVPRGAPVRTPDLLKLKVADGTPRVAAEDFRDELRLKNYPGGRLTYVILIKMFDDPDWVRIGQIDFTEDAICEGCDKRIHFWIPRDIAQLDELEAQRNAAIAAEPVASRPTAHHPTAHQPPATEPVAAE